jgi:hypothetical protein
VTFLTVTFKYCFSELIKMSLCNFPQKIYFDKISFCEKNFTFAPQININSKMDEGPANSISINLI